MACKLSFTPLRRAHITVSHQSTSCAQQIRHASLLKRPHRPYTFTQLVTLSDGSTYTHRTTSPAPIYRSLKDTRNHPLWQPSLDSLRNVEQDDAGRLRAFRKRFGRGWDVDSEGGGEEKGRDAEGGVIATGQGEAEDGFGESLMDLIRSAKLEKKVERKDKKSGMQALTDAVEKTKKAAKKGDQVGKKGGVWG